MSNLERSFRSITALAATLTARPASRPDTPLITATLHALSQSTTFAASVIHPLPSKLHALVKRAPLLASRSGRAFVTCHEEDEVRRRLAQAGRRLKKLLDLVNAGIKKEGDWQEVAKLRLAGRIRRQAPKLTEARVAERMATAIEQGKAPVATLKVCGVLRSLSEAVNRDDRLKPSMVHRLERRTSMRSDGRWNGPGRSCKLCELPFRLPSSARTQWR